MFIYTYMYVCIDGTEVMETTEEGPIAEAESIGRTAGQFYMHIYV
jgi:hypothetical protein